MNTLDSLDLVFSEKPAVYLNEIFNVDSQKITKV